MVNSPHGPTGMVFDREDLDIRRHPDIPILSSGRSVRAHRSTAGATKAWLDIGTYVRAVVISSFGKTYHTTGWKGAAPPRRR